MRSGLRCQAYSSSVHRRRYSRFAEESGLGGKFDFGSRSVLDHDARRIRVGVSILALWVGGNWCWELGGWCAGYFFGVEVFGDKMEIVG